MLYNNLTLVIIALTYIFIAVVFNCVMNNYIEKVITLRKANTMLRDKNADLHQQIMVLEGELDYKDTRVHMQNYWEL